MVHLENVESVKNSSAVYNDDLYMKKKKKCLHDVSATAISSHIIRRQYYYEISIGNDVGIIYIVILLIIQDIGF